MSRNTFINTVLFFYERFHILLFNQILIYCILFQYVLWNFYFNEIDCLSLQTFFLVSSRRDRLKKKF